MSKKPFESTDQELIKQRKRIIGFFINPWVKALNRSISPVIGGVRYVGGGIRVVIDAANRRRSEGTDYALIERMRSDFDEVLKVWGIAADQVDTVARNLKIETYLFLGLAYLSVFSLFTQVESYPHWLSVLVIVPVCLGLAIMRFWRADCLTHRAFRPFKEWIRWVS